MPKSQESESQKRIDSIIALMMEEAKVVLPDRHLTLKTRLFHVATNVNVRIAEKMRTMGE